MPKNDPVLASVTEYSKKIWDISNWKGGIFSKVRGRVGFSFSLPPESHRGMWGFYDFRVGGGHPLPTPPRVGPTLIYFVHMLADGENAFYYHTSTKYWLSNMCRSR